MILDSINQELLTLKEKKNYRSLPQLIHDGRDSRRTTDAELIIQ